VRVWTTTLGPFVETFVVALVVPAQFQLSTFSFQLFPRPLQDVYACTDTTRFVNKTAVLFITRVPPRFLFACRPGKDAFHRVPDPRSPRPPCHQISVNVTKCHHSFSNRRRLPPSNLLPYRPYSVLGAPPPFGPYFSLQPLAFSLFPLSPPAAVTLQLCDAVTQAHHFCHALNSFVTF
jgi:hypothetical protein